MGKVKEVRVKKISNAKAVGSSIAKSLEEHDSVKVTFMGYGASAQAVKAVAIARSFVAPTGKDMHCTIGFENKEREDGEKITIMNINCFITMGG